MPAGIDLIFFDNSADWELAANEARTARVINENSHEPIEPFNLGLSLNTDYVAVIASTFNAPNTWVFAGDINQVYSFPKGSSTSPLGRIQPARSRLFINKLQLIETNRVSTDNFDLRYSPPYWFKNCSIVVYKYVGEKINFVEDTLFDIGDALGIDPNKPDGSLDLQFESIQTLINQKFDELRIENASYQATDTQERLELITQLNQLDAGVYTLAEGLSELLTEQQGQDLKQTTQERLNLDLGFL